MNAYLYATKVNECESRKKGGRWQISQSSGHNAWHTIHIEFAVCPFNCVWTDSSNYLRDAIYLVKSNQLELVEVTFYRRPNELDLDISKRCYIKWNICVNIDWMWRMENEEELQWDSLVHYHDLSLLQTIYNSYHNNNQ